jgi:hypothetical protein
VSRHLRLAIEILIIMAALGGLVYLLAAYTPDASWGPRLIS